jgi:UDP-glucose 4-epimerase
MVNIIVIGELHSILDYTIRNDLLKLLQRRNIKISIHFMGSIKIWHSISQSHFKKQNLQSTFFLELNLHHMGCYILNTFIFALYYTPLVCEKREIISITEEIKTFPWFANKQWQIRGKESVSPHKRWLWITKTKITFCA